MSGLRAAIEEGIRATWSSRNLRFSQMAVLTMYDERNTGTNLPAQIDIKAGEGAALDLLFLAKGGGSASKTFLFQETRRLLEPDRLLAFLAEKIRSIGTTARPLDDLPGTGDMTGRAFRDRELEAQVLELTRSMGTGAQFGGRHFAHVFRVIRLPRHGGSLPVGMGVSCSADRQIRGRIDRDGVWLEELERDPARFLPSAVPARDPVRIDLTRPMAEIRKRLGELPVSTPVLMSGPMIVARDLVHAELARRLSQGLPLPDYLRDHPIYHAGPAKTPAGQASGAFGPTTAARMDPYVPTFRRRAPRW